MEIGFEICKWITIVLTIITAPITLWTVVTTLMGLRKPKELKKLEEKQHRFAILICARNEENVIGNLIGSLEKQKYPRDKYQVFVIADNCTDSTAQVARDNGAIVYERFNAEQRGKGFALHFGIDKLQENHSQDIDAICVFDADNLAAPDFLVEMNHALCSGADVALGYRDSKNVHDSWISEVYSIYWLMLMRFYYTSRHTMNLSSMVGGTGFAFKLAALGEEGWNTKSLTEDVEFSIQQICKGNKILPARKAVFYDEQPSTLDVSLKQRFRWMIGGLQCIPLYFSTIMKSVFGGNKKALDLAWYILFIPATGLAIPLNVVAVVGMMLNPVLSAWALPVMGITMAFGYLLAVIVAFLTLRLEKKDTRTMKRGIWLYPIFMFTMMCVALAALIHPRTEWVPIVHNSKYTIDDVNIAG
ncbi:hypothetical protein AR437_00770 [Christensenella hongkongensis]|uniref:glycosyltransferase family 2 protein n=1 Tax=Christensenella hongkongensis TaxID=270498 RepID=UPI00073FFECD|nr:glycosyltransferase family 2 protein [Christensenella hongkongensis]KUJ30553.1 hypothetical protein AR437_00770 [Christensenella hongkongensis]